MPRIISVAGVGNVEFPDDYSDDQIRSELSYRYGPRSPEKRIQAGLEAAAQPEISPNVEGLKAAARGVTGDVATALARGVIGVPEMAVGLLDIPTLGYAGKALENLGPLSPKFAESKRALDEMFLSPTQRAINEEVANTKGFLPTVGAALRNPSAIAQSVVESIPAMGAGGAIGQKLLGVAAKLGPRAAQLAASKAAPVVAGAAGEGAVTAGQIAEQIRQQNPDRLLSWQQAGLALTAGAGTGAIGAMSGRLAQRLGLEDINTILAKGATSTTSKNLAERIGKSLGGALTEGLLEELPQSAQEQIMQNLATGKSWNEGVAEAAANGLMAGVVMGGGANLAGRQQAPPPTVTPQAPPPVVTPAAQATAPVAPPVQAPPAVTPPVTPQQAPQEAAPEIKVGARVDTKQGPGTVVGFQDNNVEVKLDAPPAPAVPQQPVQAQPQPITPNASAQQETIQVASPEQPILTRQVAAGETGQIQEPARAKEEVAQPAADLPTKESSMSLGGESFPASSQTDYGYDSFGSTRRALFGRALPAWVRNEVSDHLATLPRDFAIQVIDFLEDTGIKNRVAHPSEVLKKLREVEAFYQEEGMPADRVDALLEAINIYKGEVAGVKRSLGQPTSRVPRPGLSVKQATEALFPFGFGGLPPNTEVTHRLDIVHNGREVRGWYNPATRKIWLNAAYLSSAKEARSVFLHEAFHPVQNDPAVAKQMKRLLDSVTPEQLQGVQLQYGADEQVARYEAVADAIEKESLNDEQRSILEKLWLAIKDAIAKLLGVVNKDWIPKDTDVRTVMAHGLKSLAAGHATNIEGKPWLSVGEVSTPAESLTVSAASERVAAQGEQAYAELEQGLADLEKNAYQSKLFREARSTLNGLVNLADGRLRQIPDAPPEAMPQPTEGVEVVNGVIIADDSFSRKLSALEVPHDPKEVKALQEAVAFEQQAKKALEARRRLNDWNERLDYYRKIKAPADEILRLEKIVKNNEDRLKTREQTKYIQDDRGTKVTHLVGQRADELIQAQTNELQSQAKVEAIQLDPVNEFFGDRLFKFRDALNKAKAAAELKKAMLDQTTDQEEFKRLAEEYEKYARLPAIAADALKAGNMTQQQRDAVITNLEQSLIEFNISQEQMNNLLKNEGATLEKQIAEQEKEFNAAKDEKVEAQTVIENALNSVRGESGLLDSVAKYARIDFLLGNLSGLAEMAQRLGNNLEQNRWLYDYLNGWAATPGLPAFSKANADALGVGEDVLREAVKIAGSSPQFASAIVSIADAAAAKQAASIPLQVQSALNNPAQAAQVIAQATRRMANLGGKQQAAATALNNSIRRLMALNYGANLFNQVASSPAMTSLKQELLKEDKGPLIPMKLTSSESETYLAFGVPGKTVTAPQIVVHVQDNPALKPKVQEKIYRWVQAAQEYVAGYESARALSELNQGAPTPEQLGYELPVVRGLRQAIPEVFTTNFDPSLLDPGSKLKASWFEIQLLKTWVFRQHDRVARLVGGDIGIKLRTALAGWVKGSLHAKQVAERFQNIPELELAAMQSHSKPGSIDHLSVENYRKLIFNPMLHEGRKFGSRLKAGFVLPNGEAVTKEDMALMKRTSAYSESLRREVTEADQEGGVRFQAGGKTYQRPGSSVGDYGTARHLNRQADAFIADVQQAYADDATFDPSTDLSQNSQNPVVEFWNRKTDMLRDHIFDADRDDRAMKIDPIMRKAEIALANHWQESGGAHVESLEDLAQQLAAQLPAISGTSPLSFVITNLQKELRNYERKAVEITNTRKAEAERNSGLKITLSADNEYTKPATLLELPSSLYNYGQLTSSEFISAQSRANHERLVDYVNTLRRAVKDLGVKLDRIEYDPSVKAVAAADYGGDLAEMREIQGILVEVIKDFEAAYGPQSPSMIPRGPVGEALKGLVGGVLALPTVQIRNLSLGQFMVYLMNRAMGFMGDRMAMQQAVANIPKGMTRMAYRVAQGIATRMDPALGKNSTTLQKLVDAIAPIVLTPIQLSYFNPKAVQSELKQVRGLGFDTRGSWRESLRQIKASEEMFRKLEDLEFAKENPTLEKGRKIATVGVKSVNAALAKIGVENSDQILNSLNLASTWALESHLEDVAMEYGRRLEEAGITKFDPFNRELILRPSEWTKTKSLQAAKDSLATMRLVLESSAGGEGFQLERSLLEYYNAVKDGKQGQVFNRRQREAVERRLLAEMNTSLPTNRASAAAGSSVMRALLTLNGYPSDAFLKIVGVALGGTRDRRVAATIAAKLPLLAQIALMGVIIGAAAGGASELWKRYIQGVQTSQAGVLDKDFWTNPKKFAAGAHGYLASNLSYLGDIMLALQNQVQGNRGFDISQKAFYLNFISSVMNALQGSKATLMGAGNVADAFQPILDLATRMTPGGLEIRRLIGDNRTLNTARQITAAEARAEGMEMPRSGAVPAFGPTTIVRRKLAAAVGAMADAQSAGDQTAYQNAETEARAQIAKLEKFYYDQSIEKGDNEATAIKKAKQAVWNDYQEANPIVSALGGRRPTAAQIEQLTSGTTGARAEAQRRGIQAWQQGAQVLFGRPGATTKEEVAASRPSTASFSSGTGTSRAAIAPIASMSSGARGSGRRLSLRGPRTRRLALRSPSRNKLSRVRVRGLSRPRSTRFKRLKLSV